MPLRLCKLAGSLSQRCHVGAAGLVVLDVFVEGRGVAGSNRVAYDVHGVAAVEGAPTLSPLGRVGPAKPAEEPQL